jgi:predicted Zn finger-like uncharacterized protein
VIIICEKCTARYAIPDSAIPQKGRLVKCTKCMHQWTVKLETTPLIEEIQVSLETAPSIEEVQASEVVVTNKEIEKIPIIAIIKTPMMLKIAPLMLILLISLTLMTFYSKEITHYIPYMKNLYLKQNVYDTSNMVMQNINFHKQVTDNGTDITITGKITNLSNEPKLVPLLAITLKDKYRDKIITQTLPQDGSRLNPGESHSISSGFTNVPGSIEYINLDIGNKLELFFVK